MIYEVRKLSKLILWKDNPRAIDEVDLDRLKSLIKKLDLFKPFLITQDGTILGGNQRYRACQDLGIEDVPCSIVKADTLEEKLAYALADNDRAGYYVEDKIKELILKAPNLDLEMYKLDLSSNVTLDNFMKFDFHSINNQSNQTPSEQDFEQYLKDNQDKELIRIMTTKETANKLYKLIKDNKQSEDDDEGLILLRLLENS